MGWLCVWWIELGLSFSGSFRPGNQQQNAMDRPFCPKEVREHTSFRQSPYSRTSQSPCCAMCPGNLPDGPPETASSTLPSEKCGSEGFSKDVSHGVVLEQDEEEKNLQWWNAGRQDNYCAPFAKG